MGVTVYIGSRTGGLTAVYMLKMSIFLCIRHSGEALVLCIRHSLHSGEALVLCIRHSVHSGEALADFIPHLWLSLMCDIIIRVSLC
jgi:hypothetical protein